VDVIVSGASGMIGTALRPALEAAGHQVVALQRGGGAGERSGGTPDDGRGPRWDPDAGTIDAAALEGVGAVVHLAGEPIAARRWTPEQKERILQSRARGTDLLARTLAGLAAKPAVMVSMSGVDYYGDRGDERLTERSPSGTGFLAEVCRRWEAATIPAADAGIRVVTPRSGMVLSPKGGALAQMLLPFKLGLGGRVGPGTQYVSWITLVDVVRALGHLVETDRIAGAVNMTAPNPVTNRAFTAALGDALHRPTILPTPLLPLRIRYGRELVQHRSSTATVSSPRC
jgi:uncharacterized protein (TIGR01777 family)